MKFALIEQTATSEKTGKPYTYFTVFDETNDMEVGRVDFSNKQLFEIVKTYKMFLEKFLQREKGGK